MSTDNSTSNSIVPLRLVLSDLARSRIQYWVDIAPGEVSGLGKVIYYKESNTLYVEHVFLLKQKNTAASTELDGLEVSKLMFKTKDLPGELKFWWHSHADMNVFWSGTDQATFKELGKNGWVCGTVFNKKKEMLSAAYANVPMDIWIPSIPTSIYYEIPDSWKEEYVQATIEQEKEKKKEEKKSPPPIPRRKKKKNRDRREETLVGWDYLRSDYE